jgi:serine/threonine-protein kinase
MPTSLPGECDLDALLRWACAELRSRLESGAPGGAEALLEAHPSLASDPTRAAELVLTELLVRRERGEAIDPRAWAARFPALEGVLRHRLRSAGVLGESTTVGGTGAEAAPPSDEAITLAEAPRPGAPPGPDLGPIDRHELHEPLGEGAMGSVYRARDLVLGRAVALKMIRPELLSGPNGVTRFYREAQAAAQVRHPNVLPILRMGLFEGRHCFTMPLVEGGTLADRREAYQKDARAAVALMEKVARGVAALHQKGIVHRDLKPGNVLLDESGEPLVADFGLAKFAGSAEVTGQGLRVGTPAYMSPEQAAGENDRVTAASDVWSLGVMLYELLLGRRPFLGKGAAEVAQQVLGAPVPRPRSVKRDLPRDLEAVVLRCLEREPGRRYATAGALAEDLGRWLRGEAVEARPGGWRRWVWRKPRLRLALLAAALALLGAGVGASAFLIRSRGPRGPAPVPRPGSVRLLAAERAGPAPRIVLGSGTWSRAGEEVVRLESGRNGLALLELSSSPPGERYRFRVEVKDEGMLGSIGAYLAHQRQVAPNASEHWFTEVSFAERDEYLPSPTSQKKLAQVAVVLRRFVEPAGPKRSVLDHNRQVSEPHFFIPRRGAWREMVITVTPDAVTVFWDGKRAPIACVSRATLESSRDELAALLPLRNLSPPLLRPKVGGVGLFCEKGKALFKGAVLEPLPLE